MANQLGLGAETSIRGHSSRMIALSMDRFDMPKRLAIVLDNYFYLLISKLLVDCYIKFTNDELMEIDGGRVVR